MMKCKQRKGESLNEYIARFSTGCLTVTKLKNSIIFQAFRSGLNNERSDGRRFKEDYNWINIHNVDDVREGREVHSLGEF